MLNDFFVIFCSKSFTICTYVLENCELATTFTTRDLVSSGPTCVSFFLVATSPVDRISVGWGLPAAGQGRRADYSPLFSSIFAESVSVHCSHHAALARSANAEWFTENCLHISTMSNISLYFFHLTIFRYNCISKINCKTKSFLMYFYLSSINPSVLWGER